VALKAVLSLQNSRSPFVAAAVVVLGFLN